MKPQMQVYNWLAEGLLETAVDMRRAEILNVLQCTQGWLQQPERITEAGLDSVSNRIYYLICNEEDCGYHNNL